MTVIDMRKETHLPSAENPRTIKGAVELQHRWTPGGFIGEFLRSLQEKKPYSTNRQFYPVISPLRNDDPLKSGVSRLPERTPLSPDGFVFEGGTLLYDRWPARNGISGVDEKRSFLGLISHPDLKSTFVHRICAPSSVLDDLRPGASLVFEGRFFLAGESAMSPQKTSEERISLSGSEKNEKKEEVPLQEDVQKMLPYNEITLNMIRGVLHEVDQIIVITPQRDSLFRDAGLPPEIMQVISGELFSVHSLLYEVQARCQDFRRVLIIAPAFFYQAAARCWQPLKFPSALFVHSAFLSPSLKKEFEARYGALHSLYISTEVDPLTEELYRHPAVIEAAVLRSRKNRALLILKENAKQDERQMREFYRHHQIAIDDVQIVDFFQRTEDGSIDMKVLGEEDRRLRESVFLHEGTLRLEYEWHCGLALSRFYDGLQYEGRFYGSRCSKCGKVQVPPKLYCAVCFADAFDFVPLPDTGVVESCTTVYLEFPGQPAKPPYTYGYIKLDGASTHFYHLLDDTVQVGDRVQAVWKPASERKGVLADVLRFIRL